MIENSAKIAKDNLIDESTIDTNPNTKIIHN
jgi:hypothetical protein